MFLFLKRNNFDKMLISEEYVIEMNKCFDYWNDIYFICMNI